MFGIIKSRVKRKFVNCASHKNVALLYNIIEIAGSSDNLDNYALGCDI